MGIDISGAVECRPGFGFLPDPDVAWEYAIDLAQLTCSRNYDAFGCLFGVANYAGGRRPVPGRPPRTRPTLSPDADRTPTRSASGHQPDQVAIRIPSSTASARSPGSSRIRRVADSNGRPR